MMRAKVRKFLLLSAGWVFFFVGIVGLFLPFLQGILFILVGLAILSTQYLWARRAQTWVRKRFPRVAGRVDAYLDNIHNRIERLFHGQPGRRN